MPSTNPTIYDIPPVRILDDLGIDVLNLSGEEDYLSALKEAVAILQVTGEVSSPRYKILISEVKRVRGARQTAAPSLGMQVTNKLKLGKKQYRVSNKSINVQKLLPPASEENAEELKEINDALDSILKRLTLQDRRERKEFDVDRRKEQADARKQRESRIETPIKAALGTIQKVVKPFGNALSSIFKFLKFTFLAWLVGKTFKWLRDPANIKKLKVVGKFLKDWWPSLLAGYLLFMTPFGVLVKGVMGMMATLIPKLIGLLAGPLGIAVGAAGLFTAGAWVPELFPQTVDEGTDADVDAAVGTVEEKIQRLEDQKANLNWWERFQGYGVEIDKQIERLKTGEQKRFPGLTFGFAGGGLSRGTDTIPAMLSPGEFVMSRGAVNKWGANTLSAMNIMGGGTNTPTVINNRLYAQGGGIVGKGIKGQDIVLNPTAGESWKKVVEAAAKDGIDLNSQVTSSLRTSAEQQALIDRWKAGDPNVMTPAAVGASPHQQGWAVDINYYSKANKWMREKGPTYGWRWQGDSDPVHFDYIGPAPGGNKYWLQAGRRSWIPNDLDKKRKNPLVGETLTTPPSQKLPPADDVSPKESTSGGFWSAFNNFFFGGGGRGEGRVVDNSVTSSSISSSSTSSSSPPLARPTIPLDGISMGGVGADKAPIIKTSTGASANVPVSTPIIHHTSKTTVLPPIEDNTQPEGEIINLPDIPTFNIVGGNSGLCYRNRIVEFIGIADLMGT